eukprot:scaffold368430_cov59-Attheya_sp.AAC.2
MFLQTYDLLPNVLATTFKGKPHHEAGHFRTGADYYLEPPNINGQFPILHHNFYPEMLLDNLINNVAHRYRPR